MIYDCFPFFNELDLLEIRLNHLDEVVDKFVLVEMGKTFSGNNKPFFFEENKSRYKKFLKKIIHIKVTEYPDMSDYNEYEQDWVLENYQRDCIMQGLTKAKDDDIIMISDLDEIPSLEPIKNYTSGVLQLEQKMMYYYLNNINTTIPVWIKGTKICHYSDLVNPDFEVPIVMGSEFTKKGLPTYIRFYNGSDIVPDGGWHFSFLGGPKAIQYKIKSFAHQEFNTPEYTSLKEIKRKVKNGIDMFGDCKYEYVPLDNSFPKYILENLDKYDHLILKK